MKRICTKLTCAVEVLGSIHRYYPGDAAAAFEVVMQARCRFKEDPGMNDVVVLFLKQVGSASSKPCDVFQGRPRLVGKEAKEHWCVEAGGRKRNRHGKRSRYAWTKVCEEQAALLDEAVRYGRSMVPFSWRDSSYVMHIHSNGATQVNTVTGSRRELAFRVPDP